MISDELMKSFVRVSQRIDTMSDTLRASPYFSYFFSPYSLRIYTRVYTHNVICNTQEVQIRPLKKKKILKDNSKVLENFQGQCERSMLLAPRQQLLVIPPYWISNWIILIKLLLYSFWAIEKAKPYGLMKVIIGWLSQRDWWVQLATVPTQFKKVK